ncbi:MAG: peptidylprolyl isomerase [Sphaerochaeta sp.]
MADKNVPSAENKETKLKAVEPKAKKANKEPMTFKKLITIIIIVILALLMVGGVYYVIIMLQQSKAENSNAWGYYDGEAITLENNSVFYNTLVNDSKLQTAYLNGDYNTMLSSYYGAYQAQVVFNALTKDAKAAGIAAPQDLVNDLILTAGVYNGTDGKFSREKFDASSEAERMSVNNYYTKYYPYNLVVSDMQSTILSSAENSFINELGGKTRSFEYFVIDYNAYPDEKAAEYGKENPSLFDLANVSIISASTEEKIKTAYEALQAGMEWADVVSTYSEDSYASKGGDAGSLRIFSILTNLSDAANLEQITSLFAGSYSAPLQGPGGYTIYRLDSEIIKADFNDAQTLTAVKYYINANKIDDVASYIDTAVGIASAQARTDFESAAESANATVISIAPVNNNVGKSQYFGGLSYYDSTGYLSSAASDEAVSRELFTAEEGYVTGAMAVANHENTYIIAKVSAIDNANASGSYLASMMYGYYANMQVAYDRFYNILNNDSHTDNFYTQFFSMLYSSSSAT